MAPFEYPQANPIAALIKRAEEVAGRQWREIATRLKRARLASGLTLWQVEALGGCEHDRLNSFETHSVCYVELADVLRLTALYGVSLRWVMLGELQIDRVEVSLAAGMADEGDYAKVLDLLEMGVGGDRV